MKIIIYGSEYGTAQKYAEELSRRTGIDFIRYTEIKSLDQYETIIYIGALYAGGVLGLAKTFKKLKDDANKNIAIITVGLANPMDIENTNNIKRGIKRQITNEIYEKAQIFHLRGGIDYSKLNLKHKTMMALLYKKAKNLPKEKKTSEVEAMIETYNKKVDFVDFSCLETIVEKLNVDK